MSDKLFVRDLIEQIGKLDPTLPTNIASIRTGSFQDMTRVHLLNEEQDEEQSLKDVITAMKRQIDGQKATLASLESQVLDQRIAFGKELEDHNMKMLLLRDKLRKIRRQHWTRPLPLP